MEEPAEDLAKRAHLERQLNDLLDGSLGLNIYPGVTELKHLPGLARLPGLAGKPGVQSVTKRFVLSPDPFLAGLEMAAFFLLFFGIAPLALSWLSGGIPPFPWSLLVLQFYGALWAGWATTCTRIANRSIMDVIEDVIPRLSAPVLDQISTRLDQRYTPRWRLLLISWGIGAAAASVAGYLVYHDLPAGLAPPPWLIGWWCLGWTLLYTTSAKVVNVSRFHQIFAESLWKKQALFWPNPAKSLVVEAMALVAKRMLLFWLAIAISIALILPFGLIVELIRLGLPIGKLGQVEIQPYSFTVWHLAGTGFFSIGVGSFIFLRSEAALRRVARREAAAALRIIEHKIDRLDDEQQLAKPDIERIAQLRSLHADVAEGGSYRTFVLSGLSLIIPFVPLLTLVVKEWLDRL